MSNLIFQRRDVAAALRVVRASISPEVAAELANRLDRHDRIAAAWETVLLAQACREASFAHESSLPTGCKPDLAFGLDCELGPFQVVGDIRAVSDAGREDQNPAMAFLRVFAERRRKAGLQDMVLDINIGHDRAAYDKGGRATLCLPKRNVWDRLLKRSILPVLRQWKEDGVFASRTFDEDGLELTLTRKADGSSVSAGWAGFVATSDPEDTALYKALKDKRKQLAGAPEDAVRVIVIGDGGHSLLTNNLARGPFDVTADDICSRFLRKHTSIDAIVVFAIASEPPRVFEPGFRYQVDTKFYALTGREASARLPPARLHAIQHCIGRWASALPVPQRSPWSVRMSARQEASDILKGGYEVSGNEVKVPARRAVEMLAGLRTPEAWRDEFGGDRSIPTQAILNHIISGRKIIASRIEPIEGQPGEWLVLTFGELDPNVAPFTALVADDET